jgi:hypothetical protein
MAGVHVERIRPRRGFRSPVSTDEGVARPLFKYAGVFRISGNAAACGIHLDGKRFIMATEPARPTSARAQINWVLNWFDELRRVVPSRS